MEVAYYEIKGRGDVYSIVNKKGKFKEKDNCMMLFSTKYGLQQFSVMEDYFLLETKKTIHAEKDGTSRSTCHFT
jgi:hypothetical protein